MYDRVEHLLGVHALNRIQQLSVLVLGIGGVGSYAVETLARMGVKRLILVDYDTIDLSNLNRQIMTNQHNINQYKVDVFQERIYQIDSTIEVIVCKEKITKEAVSTLFSYHPDYIIDACDTLEVKKELIRSCLKKKVKWISCMGMGNRIDASKIGIMDLRKTSGDPICRILRKMVRDEHLKGKVMVVASTEVPILKSSKIGSVSFVPSVAGIYCTQYIIQDVLKEGFYD